MKTENFSFKLRVTTAILIFILMQPGCRQPVTNPSARTGALPTIFNSPLVARNTQQSYIGNRPVGDLVFGSGNRSTGASNPQEQQFANSQFQNLNQRILAYDSDNQLLNTEIASLQQKLQLANQYNQTLKDQLADSAGKLQQLEIDRQSAIQQLSVAQRQFEQFRNGTASNGGQAMQAGFGGGNNARLAGGATIRANNSLMQRFSSINISGATARMDGDVIRVEIPTDRLFVPGTYQIQPAQQPLIQNLVGTIRQNFPRQILGIEAHWDNTPLNPPTTTHHQLTATQALAVFDQLVQLGLPRNQMFTMAMASNRPRHPQGISGGVSPNRRVELVIYPETYDGSN